MGCAGTGWNWGNGVLGGPPPAEEIQELGISSSDFSEKVSQGCLGQKLLVSTASEFLCHKSSTLPSQGCSPRFSTLSNFFLKCPGSPGFFSPLLALYEPPHGCETPLVVLSCSQRRQMGLVCVPTALDTCPPHPFIPWSLRTQPGGKKSAWREHTLPHSSHLRVPLPRCLISLRVTKCMSLLPASPGPSGSPQSPAGAVPQLDGCAAAGWMCRSWMDALRCCSRCERQRPARGRAPSGMEAAPAAAGDAQPLPWLGTAFPLTSFPPVARRVSQLSPLPSSGGQCVSWCFVQRQEKFSCRATGDSGLVLGAQSTWKTPPRSSHHRV